METLQDYNTYALAALGAATLIFLGILLRTDAEAAVPYKVTPPEQARDGWKGEVLSEPSLKARHVIRVYWNLSNNITLIGIWIPFNTMLLSRNRRGLGSRQPIDSRRHRSRNSES